jgi:hypothetical protein
MRSIRGVALGTYFAKGAEAARHSANAADMRGLVYAVKDNRIPPNRPQPINHPLHPAPGPVWVDHRNALEYVTAMLAQRIPKLTKFFGASNPREVALVPVPSSEVTTATIETARFPALRLCRALAGVGLGTVAVLAAQREQIVAKTQQSGTRRTADQILAGFVRTPGALPRSQIIVLVDDNVQSGNSLVALDRLLGSTRSTSAFAVAVTDSIPCEDALKFRTFTIDYDERAKALQSKRKIDRLR